MEDARAERQRQSGQHWNDSQIWPRRDKVSLARLVEIKAGTPGKGEDVPARQCWGEP